MRNATLAAMIARIGNMHTVPMKPVKVIVCYTYWFGIAGRFVIVAHGRARPQGTDRQAARAAGRLRVVERRRRRALCRQGAVAARPGAELPRRPWPQPAARRAARRDWPAGSDRHRLGDGGAGAREQSDQAADAAI